MRYGSRMKIGKSKRKDKRNFECTVLEKKKHELSGYIQRLFMFMLCLCVWCWWGNQRERDNWIDKCVGGRIILRWIFRKWEGVVGTGWSWLRIGTGGGRL
jgi:hypothetical protein